METQFRYEREMFPALGSALHDAIFSRGRKALELLEPSICGVIPDILYCHWRTLPQVKIKRPATIIDAHILSVLDERGRCNLIDLCGALYLSESKASESLSRLVRQGQIVAKHGGYYVLAKNASARQATLVAVEMKMSRWREALDQAQSYLKFANLSFVVLDGSQVEASQQIESAFADTGVGLLLQHGTSLRLHVGAKSFKYNPTPERFIAMHKASLLLDQSFEYPRHFLNAFSQTC